MATKMTTKEATKVATKAKTTRSKVASGTDTVIMIPEIKINEVTITLAGDSPFISHAWSEKAKKEMLAKHMKEPLPPKQAKDPWIDFCESLYWMSEKPKTRPTEEDIQNGRFGFPSIAFKAAAVDACSSVGGITKVQTRQTFHIVGELIEIQGTPELREDMVRISMGNADIRYRGEFKDWKVKLPIRYNPGVLSLEQIVNLFNIAGFAVGVGEWRPQRDGSSGMFHVE